MQRSTKSTVIVAAIALAAVVTSFSAAGQGQAPPAGTPPKPLVPVAASSVAANPDPYVGEYVTMTGAVEANLSKTSFSVDQDKTKSTGKEVLVIAPSMQKQAEVLAVGDDALLGVISDVRAEGGKGVASGPIYQIGQLVSGGVDKFPAVGFAASVYAEVYVEAQGAADLNIAVYDSAGQLVCADSDPSPIAYCGWTAANGGDFVMQVQNLGPQSSSYALMTN